MVEWHHQLNGHEIEQSPRVGDGQGGLACCDSWGHKGSDTTEGLICSDLKSLQIVTTAMKLKDAYSL